MKKQWQIHRPDIEKVKAVQRYLSCSKILATIILNRGFDSIDAAKNYLNPSLYHLQPPFTIRDMDLAVDRIEYALHSKQQILIFGDYDVDGVTATAMLYTFLKTIGAKVKIYIPHRINEGYGLTAHHIQQIALPQKVKLIITADNGSSSHNAVVEANRQGIDVIITDHHTTENKLPDALAVVNPKRKDCPSNLDYLAGVGVAFCLLICLRKRLREKGFWHQKKEPNLKLWSDFVALGTIADMVPLKADNRILTQSGMALIKHYPRPGIKSLLESVNIDKQAVNAQDVAYRLAPRLNAAGRMAHAQMALDLLLAPTVLAAKPLSNQLNQLNTIRKDTENQIIDTIETLPDLTNDLQSSIVVSGKNWHVGVLGIVASRITNRFFKPTIVFSEKNGIAKGSARSIPGVNIYGAICACKDDLIRFGGHSLAAGLTIDTKRLDQFKKRFDEVVSQSSRAEHFVEKVVIDTEIFFENINDDLLSELESLQPFGQENPPPLFMAKNIEILSTTAMGQNHRRMLLRQKGNLRTRFSAVQFNVDPSEKLPDQLNQIAFRLEWNHWNGSKKIQLILEET